MLRVVADFTYRDDLIQAGKTLSKTAFHAEHVWQGLINSGHLEQWDGDDAGELSDQRLDENSEN